MMLLEGTKPGEPRASRKWAFGLAAGLIAAGLVVGGLGLRAVAADEKNKPEKNKPEKPEKNKNKNQRELPALPDMDNLLDNLGGLDDESLKEIRKHLEEARKQIERLRKEMQQNPGQGFPGMPGAPGFAPGQGGFGGNFAFPQGGAQWQAFGGRPLTSRLGVQVKTPSATLAEQLDLPKEQGVVLEEVGTNSAAAKAGMKSHDILLELNGKTVPSKLNEFIKMVGDIKANTPVDAVVLRKGKKETVKGLTLPEAKQPSAFGGFGAPGRPGAFGGFGSGAPGQPAPFGGAGGLGGGLFRGQGGQGGKGAMTNISRNNDSFTTQHKEGDLGITIKGTIDQGKAKVSEVVISDGQGQKKSYDSFEKVPAEHKDKVKKLVEMSASGTIKTPAAPRDASF